MLPKITSQLIYNIMPVIIVCQPLKAINNSLKSSNNLTLKNNTLKKNYINWVQNKNILY